MPRSRLDIEAKLADAALRLAAKKGWKSLRYDEVAKAAKVPLSKAHTIIANKNQLLPSIIKSIDQKSFKALGKPSRDAKLHDRLFEAMMARFDQLQQHRQGILRIAEDIRHEPAIFRFILPAHVRSMRQILSQSRISGHECEKPLIMMGLLSIYYRTIWCWKTDSSNDMSRTMAALDQSLRLAGKAAELLFRKR